MLKVQLSICWTSSYLWWFSLVARCSNRLFEFLWVLTMHLFWQICSGLYILLKETEFVQKLHCIYILANKQKSHKYVLGNLKLGGAKFVQYRCSLMCFDTHYILTENLQDIVNSPPKGEDGSPTPQSWLTNLANILYNSTIFSTTLNDANSQSTTLARLFCIMYKRRDSLQYQMAGVDNWICYKSPSVNWFNLHDWNIEDLLSDTWTSALFTCVPDTWFDNTVYYWSYSKLHGWCVATSGEVYSSRRLFTNLGFPRVSVLFLHGVTLIHSFVKEHRCHARAIGV